MTSNWEHEFISASSGVYRSAFPCYRVFIYGKEVTADVLEVRINQSGGSLERMPGSCSFTLVNPWDKYVITHDDMRAIGKARGYITEEASMPTQEELDAVSATDSPGYSSPAYSAEVMWSSVYVPVSLKRDVLESKMGWKVEVSKNQDSAVVKYDREVIFDYPMQEGDCIFHPNDPVRIVFRDPYDPRIWYWMFSGFMDSFTENKGANKDSLVTITCTDVSKMLRYANINIDTGILDPEVATEVQKAANSSVTGLNLFQEFFANLNIFEILEILFFGSESWLGWQKQSVQQLVAEMDTDEIIEYLIANVPSYTKEVANKIGATVSKYKGTAGEAKAVEGYRSIIESLYVAREIERVKGAIFQGRDIGSVSNPHGVRFKRCSEKAGVSVFYIGEFDSAATDVFGGTATQIKDLKSWNDKVYTRVVPNDWYNMCVDASPGSEPPSIADTGVGNSVVAGLITKICTNTEKFPVGCGRVFYFTQAKLTESLGMLVIDRSLSSNNIVSHSVFLDRLTLLYDMADRTDFFRFYANARGDLIFELAFYDYDPDQFVNSKDLTLEYDPEGYVLTHYDIFRESYTGTYSEEIAQTLTSQNLNIQDALTGFTEVSWTDQPAIDYMKEMTIEPYEQISFSNTTTDEGVVTLGFASKNNISSMSTLNNVNLTQSKAAAQRGLIPLLGCRPYKVDPLGFIDTDEGAEIYAALSVRRVNAEMRNISISTTPKFGIMVNRPVFWKYRNYFANAVSMSHSIVWNSDCSTTINVNSVRGWSGKSDETGKPIKEYFGGKYAFDPSEFVKRAIRKPTESSGKGDK